MLSNIMIIDDDRICIALAEMILRKVKLAEKVTSMLSASDALQYFSNELEQAGAIDTPGLILLDLNMPGLNGWDFLEDYEMKYADRLARTKVIIATSSVDPQDFAKSLRYPVVIDFLNKPLTEENINGLKQHVELIKYFDPIGNDEKDKSIGIEKI